MRTVGWFGHAHAHISESLAHARESSTEQCQRKELSYHGISTKDMSNQSDMLGRHSVTALLHLT